MSEIVCDICVIGAGSGGLSVAAGAARFGQKVVLIEKGEMGGDCLNYGCVPSKALLAAAKHAHGFSHSADFGIAARKPPVDFAAVMDHVTSVIATIAPHDSQQRFEGLGVKVIRAVGRFTGPATVAAGDHIVKARRFVIATGSSPSAPPIPGLDETPYLTNETIFKNRQLPRHLIVIGGGPIGMEMAQAHRRLGSRVTVLEAFTPLGKDDPELTAVVLEQLRDEGIDILSGVNIKQVSGRAGAIRIVLEDAARTRRLSGSHLLVAAGRKANVEDLGLAAAGIEFSPRGIRVDKGLKTTNRRVYAIGDVAGGMQFTHVAAYHAGLVIRNALFRLPVTNRSDHVPWVTYTDPELAHVGLTEAEAKKAAKDHKVLRWSFADNDRAQTERRSEGRLKAVVAGNGRILGATIVGLNAGELIAAWASAIANGDKIRALIEPVAPYPTLGEVNRRAAMTFYEDLPERAYVRFLLKLMRIFG